MIVDLRSDTVTRPCRAMRQAMVEAEVGDDVFGDDPTVLRLQSMVAERFGKDAALFVPSGTMANQIAIRLHCRPGEAAMMEAGSHPAHYEAGGAAQLSGVSILGVPGLQGQLRPEHLQKHWTPDDPHFAPLTLVSLEDTANAGGGTVYPLDDLDEICKQSKERNAATHLDGARVMNAVVASGIDPARRVQGFDTISLCLSKGLGAPIGSLLIGSKELIRRALFVRKAFGGGMRQVGILAAAGIYALEHNVARLSEDHENAKRLAVSLKKLGYEVQEPETNLVYLKKEDASTFVAKLGELGILACALGPDTVRFVTHLDVTETGLQKVQGALKKLAPN